MVTHPCSRRSFFGVLAGAATGCSVGVLAQPTTAPAPALLLAREAPPDIDPAGFLVSEKLDGVRALWDGQQLRSRSGLPIAAPTWFTQRLPREPLDGELWLARGRFEAVSAAARRAQPLDAEWRAMRYLLFEAPGAAGDFAARAARLAAWAREADFPPLQALAQVRVPNRAALQLRLAEVVAAGGEGLMLHLADAPYITGRSAVLLKLKPLHDAEAVVVAHQPGRGRHAGRLGALRVRTPEGRLFELGTGLTDLQREYPPPIGSVVSYTHRGHTASGLPRFASFLRVREVGAD